jgi:hypothetical protein
MQTKNYRKRRVPHGPSKSELRSARNENAELDKTRTGTLHQRFPEVSRLQLDLRLETPMGAILEQRKRLVALEESLQLDVPCPGGCGGGHFLLTEAVEALLASAAETRAGMAICQAASYADPQVPCGTKLYFQIDVEKR